VEPHPMKRGSARAAGKTNCGWRCSLPLQKLCHRNSVEIIEANAKRLVLVRELLQVRTKEKLRQLGPLMRRQEINLAPIKTEAGENSTIQKHFFRVRFSANESEQVITTTIRQKF